MNLDDQRPAGWRKVTVDDVKAPCKGSVVSGPFGSNIGKRFFVDVGVPLIRGNNLTLGNKKFIDDGFVFITEEKAHELRNCEALPGDLIFTAAGTLGQVGIIPNFPKYPRYIISNKQLRFRCDPSLALPLYLYYWFSSHQMRQYIINQNTGASVPLITLGHLRSFPIYLPPLPIQYKIAAILYAYDDLIENNTRRIRILEEMAQMIYREWFIHFHFPGNENVRMVNSELGMIPKGWEVGKLSDGCQIIMGQSPKSEFYNTMGEGLPFHQGVTDFGERFPVDRVYCTVQNRIAERGDILFSVRAPVGRLNIANKKIVIGRGLCAIRSNNNCQYFVFHQLKELFREEDTMGGGTVFKAVTKEDMHGIKILMPDGNTIRRFEEIAQPIGGEVKTLTDKNTNLRRTRDLLLPRLISGEIDVENLNIDTKGLGNEDL